MRKSNISPMTERERLKYEVAAELGLLPKMLEVGWGGLTALETGRIGGIVARKMKQSGILDGD